MNGIPDEIYWDVYEEHYHKIQKLNLTEEEIKIQSLPELKKSLLRVNKQIDATSENDYLLYFLFDAKKIIIDRIKDTASSERIDNINKLLNDLPEEGVKREINKELSALQEEIFKHEQGVQEISDLETDAKIKIKLEQQRIDGLERKSKIWLSFLQRESAASIVGAVVLLLLTLALIVGMVFGWESQVLSNGFLVILGYFFGQSSSRNNKDNDAGGACG